MPVLSNRESSIVAGDILLASESVPAPSGWVVLACELILVLATGLLFFSRLDCALQEPEESLYAEVPRQMLAEHSPLVPVRHGQRYYDKPPLLYWLIMGSYRVFGVHDWAARLVPCSAAFLCVVVTYWWGKRAVGPLAGFAGSLILCLWPRFGLMAPMLTTNGLLTLWVVAAIATAHQALAGPIVKWRWWLLSAMACGLGLLTKGPVALALVAAPVLLYQFLDRRSARARLGLWGIYLGVAGVIAAPWFVIVSILDPSFIDYFVWTHHVRRFLDPIDHLQPFWYYLPGLLLGMLPWTLLLPGLLFHVAGRTAHAPQRAAALGIFLLASLWCLAFFSASGCKRPSYILPAMPPLALAVGCYVAAACAGNRLRLAIWACAAGGSFLVLFGAAQWLQPAYAQKYSLRTQVAPYADASAHAPVLCFPHRWDGVSFYLGRDDVRVFGPAQLPEMTATLEEHSSSLVIVKSDASLSRFLKALPQSLEFVPCSRQDPVVVGWVRRRQDRY